MDVVIVILSGVVAFLTVEVYWLRKRVALMSQFALDLSDSQLRTLDIVKRELQR